MTAQKIAKLSSGHTIPAIGLGVYLTAADTASDIVLSALEIGYRHVDSAQIYRNEQSSCEGILRFLEKHTSVKRSEIFYTTKVWDSEHGYERTKASIAKSIERLQGHGDNPSRTLGYIDLMLVHSPQSDKEKRLGTWKALQEAVAEGKIKSIGVSNYGAHHIDELLQWDGLKIKPAVNQVELHPWLQRRDLVDYCRKHGIVLEAYSPLTRGQRLSTDPQLQEYSKKYGKSAAQILIKWSLQAGFVTLPKSVHTDRIRDNFEVNDFELTPEDFENLGDKNEYGITGWDPTTYKK